MAPISLIERIQTIFKSLKSQEIIDILNQWNIDKLKLLSVTIESKLGYDLLINDEECKKFIDDIEESSIYSVAEYTQLIMFISTMGELNSRFNSDSAILNKFLVFHKMLFKTGSLVLKLLSDSGNISQLRPIPLSSQAMVANPMMANPIAGHYDTPNAQQTQQTQQSYQPDSNKESNHSKVLTVDFSRIAAEQQNLKTQQEQEKLLQIRDDEINKLQQQLRSFHLPEHLQNLPRPVTQQMEPQMYQHQDAIMESPKEIKDDSEEISDEMSLNNFLRSLALIDVPAESLS